MIVVTGSNIWMRQGDSGNIQFGNLPTDNEYNVYLAIYDEETGKIVKEFVAIFDRSTGTADFSLVPGSTDDVKPGEYVYGLKIKYGNIEDTLIPEVNVSGEYTEEIAAPTFTIAEKRVEGATSD